MSTLAPYGGVLATAVAIAGLGCIVRPVPPPSAAPAPPAPAAPTPLAASVKCGPHGPDRGVLAFDPTPAEGPARPLMLMDDASRARANAVAVVIRDHHVPAVKKCWEARLQARPGLTGGRVVARFTSEAGGDVSTACLASSDVGDDQLHECIVGALQRWRFAASELGVVHIDFPFVFTVSPEGAP